MIIKGKSRGGPSQLATHLMRKDTNETVKILQLDSPTGSIREALRDWQLIASGTQGTKGLYHAQINPDARYVMTPEQWMRTVDVLEKELGLDGQPRAIIFHEKEGRQHVHVVWQRTNIDTMKMIHDGHNYQAHERASLALEQEFGHEHVPGKHAKRDREKQPDMPKAEISHAEWQQGERAGIDPREFKEAITAIYQACDNARALQAALDERGLMIAKGDRRDYVLVDADGQIYSLARQIKGVTAKDLRAFMADVDRENIPTVEQAKALQRERAQTIQPEPPLPEKEPSAPSPEQMALEQALKTRQQEEQRKLQDRQEQEYKQTAQVLDGESAAKLADFDAIQRAVGERFDREHPVELRGFAGFFAAIKARFNPEQATEEQRQREEAQAQFLREQEIQRANQVATWNIVREHDLGELSDRHAQQRREQAARFEEERARYAREHEDAQRLLAEMEQRRQKELREQLEQSRDGPPPPKLTR